MSTNLAAIGAAFDAVYEEIHHQPSTNLDAAAASFFKTDIFIPIFQKIQSAYNELVENKASPTQLRGYFLNTKNLSLASFPIRYPRRTDHV